LSITTGPALSKARALLGEQVAPRAFELDALADVDLGIGATWHDTETPPSTARRPSCSANDVLAGEFGVSAGGTKPKARIVAHVRTGSRLWIGAAADGYHDGENTLDELAGTLREGMLNLADRGLFLHRPLDPVLRDRGALVLAGDERREIRAVQDAQDPARRL
jgi:hypothetical protein